MPQKNRYLAVIDITEGVIWVEFERGVFKYNLHMLAAAIDNPKYWDDAELGRSNLKIPELAIGGDDALS